MATSRRASGGRPKRPWFRSFHRWLGGIAAFFVLLLAITGIALNHGHEWRLDQRFVSWGWLLDAYGIHAPEFAESFVANGHRATLMGQHLYLDEQLVAADAEGLNGMVALETMLVVATHDGALLLTPGGELVERLDLATELPGPIQRLGLRDGRAVIQSRGAEFAADADVTGFAPTDMDDGAGTDWSDASPAPAELLERLRRDYRGRGLTVERLLADLHSGRIVGKAGPYIMDFIAISLIILSMTGLFQWRQRGRRNGNGKPRT